jgi:hypothetical protein
MCTEISSVVAACSCDAFRFMLRHVSPEVGARKMERRRQQTKSPTDSILTGLTDASYQAFRPHWLVSEKSLFRTRGDPQGFPATNPKQVCSVIVCSVRTREEAHTDHDAIASSFAARARMAASPSLARHVSSFAGRRRGHASQAVRCRWSGKVDSLLRHASMLAEESVVL